MSAAFSSLTLQRSPTAPQRKLEVQQHFLSQYSAERPHTFRAANAEGLTAVHDALFLSLFFLYVVLTVSIQIITFLLLSIARKIRLMYPRRKDLIHPKDCECQ